MNPEFSKKLKILSFISIIGVLVAHSYFVENNAWEIMHLFKIGLAVKS